MTTWGLDHRQVRNLAMIAGLAALSLVLVVMVEYRIQRTASWRYNFMTWNLLLAWVPVGAAFLAGEAARARVGVLRWLAVPLSAVWLVFLPNAPYLATDLIHLEPRPDAPFAYDSAMMLGFAGAGVLLGLASLAFMQDSVRRLAGSALSWLFAAGAIVLAAFGVYLGRFQRLNSWDVVSSPSRVLAEVGAHIRDPAEFLYAYKFTLLASVCLLLAYLAIILAARTSARLLPQFDRRRR